VIRQSLGSLARHPDLWVEAIRASRSAAPGRSVLPDPLYTAWRRETAYGHRDAPMPAKDLVEFLRWRKRQRGLRR